MKRCLSPFLWIALALVACSPRSELAYDPQSNPLADLEAARIQARAEHKLILVSAGGDWCAPCRRLHDFLDEDPAAKLVAQNFVRVHVYLGEETGNESFFESTGLGTTRYVPYFWVLRADGSLISASDPTDLEFADSDDYDPQRFAEFVARIRATT